MDYLHNSDSKISELQLKALYALLPQVMDRSLYAPRFSKQFQVWREAIHPPGVKDIRTMQTAERLTMQVNLGDRLGCDIYHGYFQECWDHALFMALVKPGDVVVDIGANYGMYALAAATKLQGRGRVIAFEPDVRSSVLLKQNIEFNQLQNLVELFPVCLGEKNGITDFFTACDPSFSGMHDTGRSQAVGQLQLPVRTLDSIMAELQIEAANLLKIDVEGAELDVLRGAAGTLASSDALIMLEISQKNLDEAHKQSLQTELTLLGKQGYVPFWIDGTSDGGQVPVLRQETIANLTVPRDDVSTINFFLIKRQGKYFDNIATAFHGLEATRPVSTGLPSHMAGDQQVAELDAMLWAERIEKQVVIDTCRKLHSEVAALGRMAKEYASLQEQLQQLKEDIHSASSKSEFKAKLIEKNDELAALQSSHQQLKKMLLEKDLMLTELQASNYDLKQLVHNKDQEMAAFDKSLAEKSRELVSKAEEYVRLEAKLAKASAEVAAMTSGFIGILIKIKKRLVKWGRRHG